MRPSRSLLAISSSSFVLSVALGKKPVWSPMYVVLNIHHDALL